MRKKTFSEEQIALALWPNSNSAASFVTKQ